jgi:hypothetical protein
MTTPGGPYRAPRTLAGLIAPDRRRLQVFLLCLFGLVSGGVLALIAPRIASAVTGEPTPSAIPVFVKVESTPGNPLANVTVARDSRVVGTTDEHGRAALLLLGSEGDAVDLDVRCPGRSATPKRLSLHLRRLANEKVPEYYAECPLILRRVHVDVRAWGAGVLPVLYDRHAITTTNATGEGSFAIEATSGAQFSVTLDTSARPELRPQSPTRVFVVDDTEDRFIWEQQFDKASPRSTSAEPTGELGALTIVCIPKCTEISDNGERIGPGHIFNRPTVSGHHVLALSAANGAKKSVQVDVRPGQTREVRVAMDN